MVILVLYQNNISMKIKTVGAVVFIRLLLMIGGIEPNPGPRGLRIIYLLLEIGSILLRKLFDDKVKNDLDLYLRTNPNCAKQLLILTKSNTLSDGQKKLLPPLEQNPDSTKFDTTLLTCLLRNICGLANHKDPVWVTPDINNTSVEAEIMRLRQCRNKIQHIPTAHIEETQFKDLWDELCAILRRLNKYCNIPDLEKRIVEAKTKPLDQLQQQNDKHSDALKANLISYYKKHFRTLCVSPLPNEDDRMEMLNIYARPKMNHVPYHRDRKEKISSYEQVFGKEQIDFKNIFVIGDAGIGKTAFGQLMAFLWCKAIDGDKIDKKEMQMDAKFMTKFDYVFYISLENTRACHEDVVSMIVDSYCYTSSKDKFEESMRMIKRILQSNKCLVILDGLDEWRPDISGKRNRTLPRKVTSEGCTYLTLCRPHIIETVRLSKMDIDHQIQITGFDFEKYIRDVVNYINEVQGTSKDPEVFLKQIETCKMYDQLNVPVIASHLIIVWFNYELHNMSKALIYATIVDLMFPRVILKETVFFPQKISTNVQLPKSFSRLTYLRMYINLLEKVCRLSFLLLFDSNNKSPCLVFTKEQLMKEPYCISPEEVEFFCQLGIISKSKISARFGVQEQKLSFIHSSYLDFCAALFVALFDRGDLYNKPSLISIDDISRYENFLVLLAGISSEGVKLFFDNIYKEGKDKFDSERRVVCSPDEPDWDFFYRAFSKLTIYQILRFALACKKELSITYSQKCIKLEDIFFDNEHDKDLEELLVLNHNNLKFLAAEQFCDTFTLIKGLEYLYVRNVSDSEIVGFNDVMLHNESSLHFIKFDTCSLRLKLPVRNSPHLTSICLYKVTVENDVFQDLLDYISGNILLECIVLVTEDCCGSMKGYLNLSHHSNLHTLHLSKNVELKSINLSSLKLLKIT